MNRHTILFIMAASASVVSYPQSEIPNPNKNPVRDMLLQRYLHLGDIIHSLHFFTVNKVSHRYKRYISPLNKKGWELTFSDNFDSINEQKWRLGQPWGYFHDGSLHQYHSTLLVKVDSGFLHLGGKYVPKQFKFKEDTIIIPYSIGLINSDISFMQKYGYFEIRSKNPKGPATWPAFWLSAAHKWPPEIDIFEMYGKRTGRRIHKQISSIHYGLNGSKSRGTLIRRIRLPDDTDNTFHVYACEWTPKAIKFYTDGILVRKQRVNKRLRQWMDDEMVIIINNGFEAEYLKYLPKDFKGNEFIIDWVRVYKKL